MKFHVILFSFLLQYLLLQGQIQLENFTKKDVLTSNQVTCYLVDSKGIVWLGTEIGLNACAAGNWYPVKSITDGQTGKEEQLGRVDKIYEDRKRNIWVSTVNGLFVYNGENWVHYLQEEDENFVAKDIFEDRSGRIWFGFELKKEFKEISSLQVTMVSGIIYMYDYNLWYRIAEMSGTVALKYNVPPKFFTAILLDKSGKIWITSLEGLFEFKDEKLMDIEDSDLRLIKAFDVIQAKTGDIWVASEKGVYRWNEKNWNKYAKTEGLSGDFFYKIYEDPNGRIWAFSAMDMKFTGLSMFDGENWYPFDNEALKLKGTVDDLVWSEDGLLALSRDGVARFDSAGWYRFDKKDGLSDKEYTFLLRDRFKNIWLASNEAFYRYDNKKWIKLFKPKEEWNVIGITRDKSGNIWIASGGNGAFKYSENEVNQFTVEDGLPDNYVSDIFEDKQGEIWFITKKGVARSNSIQQ